MIKKRNKTFSRDTLTKCAVCSRPVLVYSFFGFSNEPCKECGWKQDDHYLKEPDGLAMPNFVSLNKAKQLYKAGKPLTPDFEDFLEMLRVYGEVEFTYNKTRYGVFRQKGYIEFFVMYQEDAQEYPTTEEFKTKAKINGVLLKDLWNKVEKANWIQE